MNESRLARPDGSGMTDARPGCPSRLFDVFAVLGKRWNGVIIGVLLSGPARFGELARTLPDIGSPMLSRRLTELSAAGLVERHVDEGPPVAVSYRLTTAGEGLRPAIAELTRWAETHLSSADDNASTPR